MLPTYLDFKIKILKGHLKFWRFFKLVWKFSRLIEVWVDLQVFRWKIILEEETESTEIKLFSQKIKKSFSEGHHTLFTFDSHFQGNLSNRQTHTFWLTYSSFFTFTTNTCHALNVNTHIFFFCQNTILGDYFVAKNFVFDLFTWCMNCMTPLSWSVP